MNINILGANGFIGKQLVSYLSKVYSVNPVSLRDIDWRKKLCDSDVWINLVGKAHDHKGNASEVDYYYSNFELVKEVFYNFIKSDAKILIHISSLAALEELESSKPLEEDDISKPQSFYGKSKRKAEEWLLMQSLPSEKRVFIIRPPMVHGPGDKGNLRMLYKMISKEIPYPLASFKNERSFISIDNFNFYIKRIISNNEMLESGIYHIADNESVSTNEIVEIIKSTGNLKTVNLKIPPFIIKSVARIGDFFPLPLNTLKLKKLTSSLLLSNKKIKDALKIEDLPLTALEGLKKTISSFKNNS